MTGIYWIASYPKSGNTWVRLFLAALIQDRDVDLVEMDGTSTIASSRNLLERFLDISMADLAPDEAANLRPITYRAIAKTVMFNPFVLKVHDRFGTVPSGDLLFPPEATAGCIYLIRDPRDVCLSLAAHDGRSVDLVIDRLGNHETATGNDRKTGKSQVPEHRGTWSDHVESWLAAPMPRLTMRYEEIIANPCAALGAIARFCGLTVSDQAIAIAVQRTEFSRLAKQEEQSGFSERPDGMERFFRSGQVEQWRDALTNAQIARIERDHGRLMQRLGYRLSGLTDSSVGASE